MPVGHNTSVGREKNGYKLNNILSEVGERCDAAEYLRTREN